MIALSIVIVNWNTRDLLAACLASIRRHPPACAFDVWVVDNASADDSVAMVHEQFGDVRVIKNEANAGFARANNQAIRSSTSEFVLMLNSDTEVLPGALSELMTFVSEHPSAGIAGAQLFNRDGSLQQSVQKFPTCASELVTVSGIWRPDQVRPYEAPTQVEAVVGAALLARRRACLDVGLLDEDYFMYTEEVDWCYRFAQAGWGVFLVPTARVVHVNGGSSAPIALDKPFLLSHGRLRFLSQHRPIWMIRLTRALVRAIGATKAGAWWVLGLARPAQRARARLKCRANWNLATWNSAQPQAK